jgi:uncharacterized protein
MTLAVQETADGLVFPVHIQPRASKNNIAGIHGDALKIRLTAPPVGGAANKMCIAFLAKQLGVSKSSIDIVSGQTSRAKRIRVACPDDMSPVQRQRLRQRIESICDPDKSN